MITTYFISTCTLRIWTVGEIDNYSNTVNTIIFSYLVSVSFMCVWEFFSNQKLQRSIIKCIFQRSKRVADIKISLFFIHITMKLVI